MNRLSMNELTTLRWSFEQDVLFYREAGYEAIGVWRQKLTDFGEERGIELLADSGLAVSNMQWVGGFTGIDGRTYEESLDDACRAVFLASAIQAGVLTVYTGGRNNHTQRHANRLIRDAIDRMLPIAESQNVTLALEPVHPTCAAEWSVLSSLEETLELLASYGSHHLKLVYDTYHFPMRLGGTGILADLAPSIAIVHLGDLAEPHSIDQQRCALGNGKVPLEEIIGTLVEAGYSGDFDVKLIGAASGPQQYTELLGCSRLAFEESLAASGT